MKSVLTILLLVLLHPGAAGQVLQQNTAFPFELKVALQRYSDSTQHTLMKPWYGQSMDSLIDLHASTPPGAGRLNAVSEKHLINFYRIKDQQVKALSVSPLLNTYLGADGYQAGAGVMTRVSVNQRLGGSLFLEGGTMAFSGYRDSLIRMEEGTTYYGRTEDAWSGRYLDLRGHITARPFDFLLMEAGRGRHFIGDGYRSMLLGDVTPAYNYAKLITRFWKLEYTNLFTAFRHDIPNRGFRNGFGSFHLLSLNLTRWLNLGLFEAIIFEPRPESGFDVNYLNPVIFYRPVEYATGSADNALLGGTFRITFKKRLIFYGQLILDEFLLRELKADIRHWLEPADTTLRWGWWANKYGYQGGVRWLLPVSSSTTLSLRAELNSARPYTYSHGSVMQSYSHDNYPLAHPLGANFREYLGIAEIVSGRLFSRIKLVNARYGNDTDSLNFGRIITKPYTTRASEFYNFTGQGLATVLNHLETTAGIILHQPSGLVFSLTWAYRSDKSALSKKNDHFIFISLSSAWFNRYDDR